MHDNIDLVRTCIFMVEVAKEASSIIRKAPRSEGAPSSASHKKNSADIVTETDRAVESLIRERLSTAYPSFLFVGEESYQSGSGNLTDEPTFIVDPIDGTSNFVHGLPDVCISIGLVVKGHPAVGVVYCPFRDELWSAVRGRGAFYQHSGGNEQKLPLAGPPPPLDLTTACVGIEWGSDRQGPNFDLNLRVFTALARTKDTGGVFVNSLRCIGSAALAICRVASGTQEAFWECGCWAWDVAAAWCILNEAGGIMVDGHPGNWNPEINNRRYLAVRAAETEMQQKEFVEVFWGLLGDERSTYGPTDA